MSHLDWLVTPDWLPTETSLFWKGPGMDPKTIGTTVYYLPAALIYEKPGLIANSGRWLQWRHQACTPWDEAMPEDYCEMSPELAALRGIENGDYIRVFNNRGSIEVTVLVTPRMKPFTCDGETIHQIGLTHSYGWAGIYGNANQVTNDLSANVGDANSSIPEYKCFLADFEKIERG